jgi:hypothetical protein
MNTLTRGALFGAACAACAILAAGSAAAQTYPPGTNCQSLLPGLRDACINQAEQMNSGNKVIPNSGGANAVPAPGSLDSGVTVDPNGTLRPTVANPNSTPNGTVNGKPVTIIPPVNSGTGAAGAPGTSGTGTGAGGAGTGASGN